jgi:heat shock protein HslJ
MYVSHCVVMRKLVDLFLLLLVFACSKMEHKQKILEGNWKLNVVRIEDGEGFIFYDSAAVGTFSFLNNTLSGSADYTYSYFGQYQVSDSVLFENTAVSLSTDGMYIQIARPTDTLQAKLIMLTKKQLTFEYYDFLQYRLKRFSLTKQ